MARAVTYAVFIIPLILSIIFGSSVLAVVLQEPGRGFGTISSGMTSSSKSLSIVGLEKQYDTSSPINIQVAVSDNSFDCGDVYITIYEGTMKTKPIKQKGFFGQCFVANNGLVPIGDSFSEIVDSPGKYEIVVEMLDKDQKQTISTASQFNVR